MVNINPSAVSTFTGHCLCGKVSLAIKHDKPHIAVCHCSICRRWGGGPFMSVESHQVPLINGIEHVTSFPSSDWAERGFCMHCGTHLFYRLKDADFYALSAGLFTETGEWPLALQVFIDEKPKNYSFANKTRTMTGEQVFQAWAPKDPGE